MKVAWGRWRTLQVLIAASLLTGISFGASGAQKVPSASANGELLLGTSLEGAPRAAVFKGIPYAAPPVGSLRWAAPQPHPARPGAQAAQQFAAACYQDDYNANWYRRVMRNFGANPALFANPAFSEDCLYLNVWTPQLNARAKLPVMVWIHGGSNKAGWSFEPNYHGQNLALRGKVVVVSIGYRLGVFGFISHPELTGTAAAANFGLLDQIAALRWIQQNIAAFGGDAHNITVFGESAGAADIGYLLTSPAAAGLFKRAISQSGGYLLREHASLAQAQVAGAKLARYFSADSSLEALRRRGSAEIFQAAATVLADYDYGPVIDGRIVRQSPATAIRDHGIGVDLLIGSNENESYMYVDDQPAGLEKTLAATPVDSRELLRARASVEPDVRRGHDRVSSLTDMGCPPYLMAGAARANAQRSWVYRFTRVRPGPGAQQLLAYHGAEIPYVFDTHDEWLPADAADRALTNTMLLQWSNFARTGNPNGTSGAQWPAFDPTAPQVLELGTRIAPIPAPDHAFCKKISSVLYPADSVR